MPGWHDKKSYAYTKGLSPAGWAFEFLRRNKEYRADFVKVSALRQRWEEKYAADSGSYLKRHSDPEFRIEIGHDLIAKDLDWSDATMTGPNGRAWMAFEDFYQLKWGLAQPIIDPLVVPARAPRFRLDPRFPMFPRWRDVETFFLGEDPSESYGSKAAAYAVPYGQRHGAAVVVFDLTAPLTGQLRKAEKELRLRKANQKKAGLLGKGNRSLYQFSAARLLASLRVLDGVTAGAKKADIWRKVFEPTQHSGNPTATVNDYLRPAKLYVSGRYRLIAASDVKPM